MDQFTFPYYQMRLNFINSTFHKLLFSLLFSFGVFKSLGSLVTWQVYMVIDDVHITVLVVDTARNSNKVTSLFLDRIKNVSRIYDTLA